MKHKDLIEKMTLEEKAAILSGKTVWQTRNIDRLGIVSISCADGPHGLRKQAGEGDHLGLNASLPATCFPTAATVANSWDAELAEEIGRALGEEAVAQDVQILLGPGLNIKRNPLCGRNFEYFSEDPYLSGKMAAAYIRGIQSRGIYACPKHFAVNSQELRRMAMNSVIDERTLREIYLTGFEIAVREGGAKAVMTSYNEVNGVYADENKHLLQEILRDEWGFDGIVITDWGASNDHVKGVQAGSNLEMPAPGLGSAREICDSYKNGTLNGAELDEAVDVLLDAALCLGGTKDKEPGMFDTADHHQLAKRAAVKSAVLLKNEDGILPLSPRCRVALIGDFAAEPRYQGAGSSMVNPTKLDTMEKLIEEYDVQIVGINRGYQRDGAADIALEKAALDLAGLADVVIYCFGLTETGEAEGMDRLHMRIPQNQIHLLEKIARVNDRVVGVLSAGSALEMPWEHDCKALLHGYLNGQAGAGAILDLVTGKEIPSGKLNETYLMRYEETPSFCYFPSKRRNSEYRESIYVGYRYFDSQNIPVRYPFGFGLSYTEFEYSGLKIEEDCITFTIKNTGNYDGAEVAQMYVELENARVFRPRKELKGFKKVFLKSGESKEARIPFDDKTFRYWNVKTNRWETEEGVYRILVGSSVEDIRLEGNKEVCGTTAEMPYDNAKIPSYYEGRIREVGDAEYKELLGRPIPDDQWAGDLTVNDAICQMYYAKSGLARMVYKILTYLKNKSEKKGKPDLNILFIYNMPFRGIAKMTGGMVDVEMAYGMVDAVNGRFFKGMKRLIVGFVSNAKKNRKFEQTLSHAVSKEELE